MQESDPFLRAVWSIILAMVLGVVGMVSWITIDEQQLLSSGRQDQQILQEFCTKYHVNCEPSITKIVQSPTTLPVHSSTTTTVPHNTSTSGTLAHHSTVTNSTKPKPVTSKSSVHPSHKVLHSVSKSSNDACVLGIICVGSNKIG